MLGTLNNERIFTAAVSLGILDGVIEEAVRYAREREAFGRPIAQFQVIQHRIADMLVAQNSAQLSVFDVAWRQSRGSDEMTRNSIAEMVGLPRSF